MTINKYLAFSVLALFLIFASCTNKNSNRSSIPGYNHGIVFAHRGVVAAYPENSLESAEDASEKGFTALELDLRKSNDNKWMLFHDENGKRLLGIDSSFNLIPLNKLTTSPLFFNGIRSNSYVLPLSELLKKQGDNFTFYFDVKVTGFKEAEEIADTIIKYCIADKVIVASADVLFILYLEWKHPQIFTALEGMNSGKEWMWSLIPERIEPDFLSGFLERIDQRHVNWLKKKNLLERRIVYGVDSTNYLMVRQYGIKHLIVDYYHGMADQM